jgi:hypothetical protein
MTAFVPLGATAISKAPEAISRSGSSPSAWQMAARLQKHRYAFPHDAQSQSGGRRELKQASGESTLRRIVHRMHVIADAGGRQRGVHDADARINQESLGAREQIAIDQLPQSFRPLTREYRRALDRDSARQQDLITHRNPCLADKARWRDLAQHLTDHDRAVQAGRDLRMSAADRNPQLLARRAHVSHDAGGELRRRVVFRQQQDDEEPQRARAEDGHVVRVDVHGVPTDVIGGERDGVGRDDEIPIASLDHSGSR